MKPNMDFEKATSGNKFNDVFHIFDNPATKSIKYSMKLLSY